MRKLHLRRNAWARMANRGEVDGVETARISNEIDSWRKSYEKVNVSAAHSRAIEVGIELGMLSMCQWTYTTSLSKNGPWMTRLLMTVLRNNFDEISLKRSKAGVGQRDQRSIIIIRLPSQKYLAVQSLGAAVALERQCVRCRERVGRSDHGLMHQNIQHS
jgi:hypothetical protein